MSNRLAHATSPYLLQHADNPLDWQEWGPQAFAEARERNVPILLSVGYAACHWCHVMAHESFSNPDVAKMVNANFVAIKVDREERPDIDALYMQATQAMTGRGGWPMTCFLTPNADPFYCGTYYPHEQFMAVLEAVDRAWRSEHERVMDSAETITARLRSAQGARSRTALSEARLDAAVITLAESFDARHGGFGDQPKFPPSMALEFLLRNHARTGSDRALRMAEETLAAMARGGIYDQLAGGFARYSVDGAWAVPHFEKMLYDNALLLGAYVSWYRATGSPLADRITRELVQFLLRDLRTEVGGFASSLDADSGGVEGATYVWSRSELVEVLGAEAGEEAAAFLGIEEPGNFSETQSTLRRLGAAPSQWPVWREQLLVARDERVQPGLDDKVIASWNGLAIAALAGAGALFEEESWLEAATECAEALWRIHVIEVADDGATRLRLNRSSRAGQVGQASGVADDYGNLAAGLLALHQATGQMRWLERAGRLLDTALALFSAPGEGAFFDTAATDVSLRTRSLSEGAEPSGTAALASALTTYAALTGEHRDRAVAAVESGMAIAALDPRFAGWTLATAEALIAGPLQVAIVGSDSQALAMERVARQCASPGIVVVRADGNEAASHPLFEGRTPAAGEAGRDSAAYLCRGFVCDLPAKSADELREQLSR